MKSAYVDTSCLVAIALGENGQERIASRLADFDQLFSSNLLEAELRATLSREGVQDQGEALLTWLWWVYPDRRLTSEFEKVLGQGLLKGADLWHLACALYLRDELSKISFLSLDERQAAVAASLGFAA